VGLSEQEDNVMAAWNQTALRGMLYTTDSWQSSQRRSNAGTSLGGRHLPCELFGVVAAAVGLEVIRCAQLVAELC
jgi:hypothetical protein